MRISQKHIIVAIIVVFLLFLLFRNPTKKPKPTWSKGNDAVINELHPDIRYDVSVLINRVEKEVGVQLTIISGYRSIAEQEVLKKQKGKFAASPGKSFHNYGLAVDIRVKHLSQSQLNEVVKIAKELGFEWGGNWKTIYEPWHFQKTFGLKTAELYKQQKAGKFAKYPVTK